MKLPKELTTVTLLSKSLALVIFLITPVIAFGFGIQYQQTLDLASKQQTESLIVAPIRIPTPTPINPNEASPSAETATWKIFTSLDGFIRFKYPNNWFFERINTYGDNGVGFFLNGTKPIHSASEEPGNEVLVLFIFQDLRTLEELKNGGNKLKTQDIMVSGKNGFIDNYTYSEHTFVSFKPSPEKTVGVWFRTKESQKYFDQILSTFQFTQ